MLRVPIQLLRRVFYLCMVKRKRPTTGAKGRRKKRAKREGPLKRKIKKKLNKQQRECFRTLRACIKQFSNIAADKEGIEESKENIKSFGERIVAGAKGLARVAKEISEVPGVKLAAQTAVNAFLRSKGLPPLAGASAPTIVTPTIEETGAVLTPTAALEGPRIEELD